MSEGAQTRAAGPGARATSTGTPLKAAVPASASTASLVKLNWKTQKSQAGCWTIEVRLADGTVHVVGFELR